MPLFGRFKANFQLLSRKKRGFDNENTGEPICGAYRINREEFLCDNADPSKRNTTPIVQMTYKPPTLKQSKSSNDIIIVTNPNTNTRQSMPDIVQPKAVPRVNKNEREQKKLEKQKLVEQRNREIAEQKKRVKLALQEQQRQEKMKRDREKQERIEKAKSEKNKSKKRTAPQPQATEPIPTVPKPPSRAFSPTNYSTNTLESSISRSSGPPPYTAEPDLVTNQKDITGNTSFSPPPEDLGSWDIISQHREQLNRPKATAGYSKQTHMDLNYNMDLQNKDNSDA